MRRDNRTNTYTGYTQEDVVAKFQDAYSAGHIVRWLSNDQVPNPDMIADWYENDLISQEEQVYSLETRDEEQSDFLQEYFTAQANRSPEQIAEEQMMARDAFGNQPIVNVITGEIF